MARRLTKGSQIKMCALGRRIHAQHTLPDAANTDMIAKMVVVGLPSTYYPELLKTVAGAKYDANSPYSAKVGSVELIATPERTIGEQALTLRGRTHEVADILATLAALDTVAGGAGEYVLYEVKHLDPRGVREDLMAQFPGLQVTILPGAASNPAISMDQSQTKQTAEFKNDPNAQGGGAGGANGGNQQGGQGGGKTTELLEPDKGEVSGIALPFRKFEAFAFPMKIMLRGNKGKID